MKKHTQSAYYGNRVISVINKVFHSSMLTESLYFKADIIQT